MPCIVYSVTDPVDFVNLMSHHTLQSGSCYRVAQKIKPLANTPRSPSKTCQ